ncbi:MAG: lantibiotic dehydratase [Chitinophagaceae bacterium]|nr:lantibiotic dehydratase [Chitinophagaceae bacterium]
MNNKTDIVFPFYFLDELVMRTPALPFVAQLDEEVADELLKNEIFMEALYLASPVLHAECINLQNGNIKDAKEISKISLSLVKYYQRMYSRCTPFGLFSGCSPVKWAGDKTSILLPAANWQRSTRLDMHYLCALAQQLAAIPEIKQRLLYFPNTSAYKMGEELRYVEFSYSEGRRIHQVTSVAWSDYLQAVLDKAAGGATIAQMAATLTAMDEIETSEAEEFIHDMISSQVLTSEMEPAITGEEFIHQLLAVLNRINVPAADVISQKVDQLNTLVRLLEAADKAGHNPVSVYTNIIAVVQQLGVPFEAGKLFQADMFSRPSGGQVDEKAKGQLQQAIRILAKLYSPGTIDHLSSFAERFRKRYEDQEVPLLTALDGETGVGFIERMASNLSPLLENLVLPSQNNSNTYDVKWNQKEEWLFSKLMAAGGATEVTIEEKELAGFAEDFPSFPPSLSVMFSLTADGTLIFKGANGSSAANLLGRFAHGDKSIDTLVRKITGDEQEKNSDIIFAEIVHLPEDRVGNILLHPAFRTYEIPFLARSSRPMEQQVALQDIMIRVSQNHEVTLFSKKLNRQIIPRLTSAHNFSFRSLPVYYFLGELQSQSLVPGLLFGWGSMARHFKRLPRVRCGNVILAEATWQLPKDDFIALADGKETINAFQQRQQLGHYFLLADGDNEMLVDTGSALSVNAFVKALKGREFIVLKEFHQPAAVVTDEDGQAFTNQFIAVLMNEQTVYPATTTSQAAAGTALQRDFMPGSEWLYYKLYCGTKTADEILLSAIAPLLQRLQQENLIDKWFFIRYNDPDFHLRIRFHLPATAQLGMVMQLFQQHMEPIMQNGLVWKVQTDTYQREAERYGYELVGLGEDLFYTDSKTKIDFLQATEGDEREKYRWPWAMRAVDEWLDAFGYPLENKYNLMQEMQRSFAGEFNADKSFFRQLNQQYNTNRQMILLAMEKPATSDNELKPVLDIFEKYHGEMKERAAAVIDGGKLAGNFQALDRLLNSYIHMCLNRIFLSEPRLHELVVYDMLCTYYRFLLKRKPA